MSCYRWDGTDLILQLRVQTRARRDAWGDVVGDAIKLSIAAPPVDGKANESIIKWLAAAFDIPRSHVVLVRGDANRSKVFRIVGPRHIPPELTGSARS